MRLATAESQIEKTHTEIDRFFFPHPNHHNFLIFWSRIKFLVSRIMYSSRSLHFYENFSHFGTLGYPTKAQKVTDFAHVLAGPQ